MVSSGPHPCNANSAKSRFPIRWRARCVSTRILGRIKNPGANAPGSPQSAALTDRFTLPRSTTKMGSQSVHETDASRRGRAALRQALAEAGWRFTRQREAVYAYLRSVDCHPSAEQVYAAVKEQIPHISLATVYKALEALV